VANQLRVSLSTLKGAWEMRDRLKTYQAGFNEQMLKRAGGRKFEAWVIGDDGDPGRALAFLDMLELHQVEYSALGETVRAGDHEFRPGSAWVIPAQQNQFGLIEAMMEQRTSFADNTFYDVSAWTLPLAYNLPFATLARVPATEDPIPASRGVQPEADARSWLVPWNQLEAPALLGRLLDVGARVRTSRKAFTAQAGNGLVSLQPGTMVIQAGIQDPQRQSAILELLNEAALSGLEVHGLVSSLTPSGPDFGASHFPIIEPVRPLIIGGEGVSSYDTGTAWHLLDHRLKMATPMVELQQIGKADLRNYTHMLLADGRFSSLSNTDEDRITRWVKEGGILVTSGRASTWAESLCFRGDCPAAEDIIEEEEIPAPRSYGDFADDRAELVIGGAIVATVADLSHPLAYGLQRPELPLFRQGTTELEPSANPYATPVRYATEPLLAGFIGEQRIDAIRGQPAVIAERMGDGLVVRFANNPLFRGFWRGTEKLFLNALFFGQTIQDTTLPKVSGAPRTEPEKH
jgi:hypothetical protein